MLCCVFGGSSVEEIIPLLASFIFENSDFFVDKTASFEGEEGVLDSVSLRFR